MVLLLEQRCLLTHTASAGVRRHVLSKAQYPYTATRVSVNPIEWRLASSGDAKRDTRLKLGSALKRVAFVSSWVALTRLRV